MQGSPRCYMGTLDNFVSMSAGLRGATQPDKMVPDSPGMASRGDSPSDLGTEDTLHGIRAELARIGRNMLTRADTSSLGREIREAIREDLVARVDAVEAEARLSSQQHRTTEMAATRQGNMLISLRRQVEDLENRSRRQKIQVKGAP
ncbi:Hypothetical predicted protein [Pelobates cultripes]|uniref:Uncharacterized protein n=1 Tax=Pelobates cultripes TaxID=61616 RepID=A0AAD1RQD7_PELCU|nr:Hypothetical predicted protein [Pelobates cultripes]